MSPVTYMFDANKTPFGLPLETAEDNAADIFFAALAKAKPEDPHWAQNQAEGQLAVDVLETSDELIIIATMAGTRPEDIELHLHNDFLTIRGQRQSPAPSDANYFNEECFWGVFSRTIVLPVDVKSDVAKSEYKNGVLTIRLPKAKSASFIPIMVVED